MPRIKKFNTKRKFTGNMYTRVANNSSLPIPGTSRPTSAPNQEEPRPSASVESASKKKLSDSFDQFELYKSSTSNIVISHDILSTVISKFTACKECGCGPILDEDINSRNGLACKLSLRCSSKTCSFTTEFWTSDYSMDSNMFDINSRLFYGLRCIGKGPEAGKLLCGMVNLPKPSTNVGKNTTVLRDAVHTVAEKSMKKATLEAVTENSEEPVPTDIPIDFDGSWQKRGFVSKNAACTVTSVDNGKVIDVEILTKYCSGCDRCKGQGEDKTRAHEQKCVNNYEGSSGGMEIASAVAVCQRSIATRGVRYVKFLGDDDSKSFSAVLASKPYGDTVVTKLECTGHVKKRMGCRVRNLKKELGSTPLSDGKAIKGAARLTDLLIDKLQEYYGKTMRRQCGQCQQNEKSSLGYIFL